MKNVLVCVRVCVCEVRDRARVCVHGRASVHAACSEAADVCDFSLIW